MSSILAPTSMFRRKVVAALLSSSFKHTLTSKLRVNVSPLLPALHRKHFSESPKMQKPDDIPSLRSKENLAAANDPSVKNLSLKARANELWNKYGAIALGTHFSVWVVTLSTVFVCMDLDIFNAATFGLDPIAAVVKACDWFEYYTGNTHLPEYVRENPRVGTLAIAFIMTKFTEPARILITLTTVPIIGKWIRNRPVRAMGMGGK